ncbi:MAG: prolyl oligopeptidase family serine peptidase [Armatimonadia bacterium]
MPRPLLILLCLVWPLCAFAQPHGLSQIVTYTSSLDNSPQSYGVYLPAAPAPSAAGYPAVFHAHGYGWSVSSGFSQFQKDTAERYGWVLINLNARGPQFYEGVGDVEARNVLRDAHRRFGLDLNRIFITGGSMGGTGAFRFAIRYPDLFAAAVGVDGWSDYLEWHYHWYARADQQNDIEEVRRPLLEACSPLYWAGRARWARVQASVSGRDTVVGPRNGLDLYGALLERSSSLPGAYENRLFLDENAGHGGSTRLDQIYNYFANYAGVEHPQSFLCETPILTHGNMYWGSMLRQKVQGAFSSLESDVQPAKDDANGEIVTVLTKNLSEFALHLQASPAAEAKRVSVYVDGFSAYEGPPTAITLRADWSPEGAMWGWHVAEANGLRKSPELEGPIGEAFKVPFTVVYGTAAARAETEQNRREALDFVRGWNAFMVHAEALVALPEEKVSDVDVKTRSLVIFGTEASSRLLREAQARSALPVRVQSGRVLVSDPQWGDREYLGDQFGAFFCYPNPLSDFSTYLVVLHGQWATKADGTGRQGLEYDLEKLPWAYPDYVVFNMDQAQLPHVLNVNNKPPVTCYEAGYFVESGYFSQDWRPYRAATLDRVRAMKLPVKRLHVATVTYDPGSHRVAVQVVDEANQPFARARVTARAVDGQARVTSALTDQQGFATFAGGAEEASVVNVDATGAVYDWTADWCTSTSGAGVGVRALAKAPGEVAPGQVTVEVAAPFVAPATVSVQFPAGTVTPAQQDVRLLPNVATKVAFTWEAAGLPAGAYLGLVTVRLPDQALALTRPVWLELGQWQESPLRLVELKAADLVAGGRYEVTARLLNTSSSPCTVPVSCALLEGRRYLPAQSLTVSAGQEATVSFRQPSGDSPLPHGPQTVRVSVPGHCGVTSSCEFMVKAVNSSQ